jgi:hypothetical protein
MQKDIYIIVKDIGHGVLVMGIRLLERLLFDKSKTLSLGISQIEGGIEKSSKFQRYNIMFKHQDTLQIICILTIGFFDYFLVVNAICDYNLL